MIGMKLFAISAALASALAQTNGTSCVSGIILSSYSLTSQTAATASGSVCQKTFPSVGACATPDSVKTAMTNHNNWLQSKAIDAVSFAYQYPNATYYWQIRNGVLNSSTPVPTTTTNTSTDSFWGNILNTVTNAFKNAWSFVVTKGGQYWSTVSSWYRSVFNNHLNNIPICLQNWANITNGAYCTAASANIGVVINNDVISISVDAVKVGNALLNCRSLVDTYCQLSYGISLDNDTSPFNTTFNWNDYGISNGDCSSLRQHIKNSLTSNIQAWFINVFESHFIRFIPSGASIINFGNFLNNTNTASTSYVPTTAASSGKSFKLTTSSSVPAVDVIDAGQKSGQPNQSYNVNSVARLFTAVLAAFLALLV